MKITRRAAILAGLAAACGRAALHAQDSGTFIGPDRRSPDLLIDFNNNVGNLIFCYGKETVTITPPEIMEALKSK